MSKYTLVYRDTADKVVRIACNTITPASEKPFRIIQTYDESTPDNASPTYLHQWLTPATGTSRDIIAASYPGCQLSMYDADGQRLPRSAARLTAKDGTTCRSFWLPTELPCIHQTAA